MNTKRNDVIDFMRGLAILLMILVHVTPYFRSIPSVNFLWNYTHFVVPLFIFCSAYVFFKKNSNEPLTVSYFIKRAKRLLIPYYIFLSFYYIYIIGIKGDSIPWNAIANKLFFWNAKSADFEWLVVLFLYVTVILPVFHLFAKKKIFVLLYVLFSTAVTVALLFVHPNVPYRFIMWIPWSLYIVAVWGLVKYETKRWFLPIALGVSLFITIAAWFYLKTNNLSLILTNNKYPPNIFYIAYGVFFTFLIYRMHSLVSIPQIVKNVIYFFSRYSYSIFFIHFLIIYVLLDFTPYKKLTWWGMTLIVTGITVVIQMGYNYFRSMLKKAKPL